MYCKNTAVRNFRNIEEAKVEFSEGVNVLVGENAQGKTNLMEAIFLASVGRSFRASNASEMIMFGKRSATVTLEYIRDTRERADKLELELFCDKKKIVKKNNLKLEKMSDIVGSFRAVLFCPEHLALIKDGPSERRSYLDIAISRISPAYIRALQKYNYYLKQRNMLIKNSYQSMEAFNSTVDLWSEKMAEEAALIAKMRVEFIKRVSGLVGRYFEEMSESREKTELVYHGTAGIKEEEYIDIALSKEKYFKQLMSSHDRELSAGVTLFGVHKDDIDIRLNQKSARSFGSQGQQRSLALAMKLAEGEICKEEFGDYPVFLFDDVLSELDETRRDYMLLHATNKQVIISTCECDFARRMKAERLISVKNGTYSEN